MLTLGGPAPFSRFKLTITHRIVSPTLFSYSYTKNVQIKKMDFLEFSEEKKTIVLYGVGTSGIATPFSR